MVDDADQGRALGRHLDVAHEDGPQAVELVDGRARRALDGREGASCDLGPVEGPSGRAGLDADDRDVVGDHVGQLAGEGRALYAAVAEQGVWGVLARARTSPYLPGVRSRLWRVIAVRPSDAGAEGAADEPEAAPVQPAAPVLTVLRRLPLDFD